MHGFYYALLWIRDILVWITDLWIRIRILLFTQVADKMPTKNKFFQFFFAYTEVFQNKKSKNKSQNSKIHAFLSFLHVDGFYGMVC
jgi:hypothetical protein